jgi:hypothetical protein
MLNSDMKFDDICNSILERVFHGTPHDVGDKFDLNKVGSGEGAQVYGWGLYFAENPDVAQDYRKNLSGYDELTIVTDKGKKKGHQLDSIDMEAAKYLEVGERIAGQFKHNTVYYAKKEAEKAGKNDVIARIDEYGRDAKVTWEKNLGNVYEVDIAADKENDFLDWDKPLSEQSRNIFEILKYSGFDVEFGLHKTGQSAYEGEVSIYAVSASKQDASKKASEFFNSIGIKGIKYLDQGSRGSGEGTYNYVVFDPSIIKIVAKNGQFVMNSKKPENVEI